MSEQDKNFGKGEGEDAIDKINKGKGDLKNEASESFEEGKKSTGESIKEKAKDFSDKANEKFDEAKKKAQEFTEEAKEKTKEFTEDTKKTAHDFEEGAKKTANEFTEGAKEAFAGTTGENKKLIAGILAIILGALGIHKFILGYQKEGLILLGITLASYVLMCFFGLGLLFVWIPGLIGLIEGIIYLTKSDEEFYNTYQVGRKPWF